MNWRGWFRIKWKVAVTGVVYFTLLRHVLVIFV